MTIFAARAATGYYPPVDGTNTSTYGNDNGDVSWDNTASIGSAAASRIVVVAAVWVASATLTWTTLLASVAATQLIAPTAYVGTSGERVYAGMWYRALPTGTTARVDINLSANSGFKNGVSWSMHRLVGIDISKTVVNRVNSQSSPIVTPLNVRQGDYVIGLGIANQSPTLGGASLTPSTTPIYQVKFGDAVHSLWIHRPSITATINYQAAFTGSIGGGATLAMAAFRA